MNTVFRTLIIVSALLVSADAHAALVKYEYAGGLYSITMTIDEDRLPGGTLKNASVDFGTRSTGSNETVVLPGGQVFTSVSSGGMLDGLYSYYGYPIRLFPTAFGRTRFTTDANRNMISWLFDADEDGTYFRASSGGDYFHTDYGNTVSTAPPGTWNTTVIPLPATFPLLAAALSLAGLLGWSRARQSQR